MNSLLIRAIDERVAGALTLMSEQDARTPALQLLWLVRREAQRRGLLSREQKRRTCERVHNPGRSTEVVI